MAETRRTSNEQLNGLMAEVAAERLMEYNRTIAQWVRLSGSEEERQSFDYVEATMRDFGYQTQRYAPMCFVSLPVAASLTLLDTGEQLRSITHSFSTSTGPGGVTGEVVYVGAGLAADYQGKDLRGKIALVDGLAGPPKVEPAERSGAIGVIHANPYELHDMIVSPVWGNPDASNIGRYPTIPHISIDGQSGARLKELLAVQHVQVRITAEVDTGWRPLPVLLASVSPAQPSDDYVLLSGHIDSWYHGAMDNGSANAAMMETARVLAAHRDLLRRGVRVAFWSGHSHARYAGSAWFVDEFWQDLHEHCVGHVNIDSPGGIGATAFEKIGSMAEAYGFARDMFAEYSGAALDYQRIGRGGDQSFWGVGVPSVCGKIYAQPKTPEERRDNTAIFGWWWHTPDDTLDKVDPANLVRDTQVLLAATYRIAADRVLPYDQTAAVDEIRQALSEIATAAGDAIDFSAARHDADALRDAAARLNARARESLTDEQAERINTCLLHVSHLLIPVNYTVTGPFSQDPAIGAPALPALRPAARLASLPPDSAERNLTLTTLRRERNRLRSALIDARRAIEETLEWVEEQ